MDCEYEGMLKCCVCVLSSTSSFAECVSTTLHLLLRCKDHDATDMQKRAMLLFKNQSSADVTEYLPIALYYLHTDAELKVKGKFDIAYLIAKHYLASTKMKPLCELKERHWLNEG